MLIILYTINTTPDTDTDTTTPDMDDSDVVDVAADQSGVYLD